MHISPDPPIAAVEELLACARLPSEDLAPELMENFFGAWSGPTLVGVVGIEPYAPAALLRSLAVRAAEQGRGLGASLLMRAERLAADKGIDSVFLLTTTAESYFARQGYAAIARELAPACIRHTREFAGICPSGAILMVKRLPVDAGPGETASTGSLLSAHPQ